MTTEQYLGQFGVTMDVARDFFVEYIPTDLTFVYEFCQVAGITNSMIADILQSDLPGLNAETVSAFFDGNGFDGSALNGDSSVDNTEISIASGFTEEWLNNRTLYGAFDWEEDGWTYSKTTFIDGVVTYEDTIDGDFFETYVVLDNGTIYVNTGFASDNFIWEIQDITDTYIDVTGQASAQDLFFFEQENALNYINSMIA